jgi:hypothetical protein
MTALALPDQPAPEVNWGIPHGSLQIGWERSKKDFRMGDPVRIALWMRKFPDEGQPIMVYYLDPLVGLYTIHITYGSGRSIVELTPKGKSLADPDQYLGARGDGVGGRVQQRNEIELNDVWDISKPGHYVASIVHIQSNPVAKTSFTVRAPDFAFNVLPPNSAMP